MARKRRAMTPEAYRSTVSKAVESSTLSDSGKKNPAKMSNKLRDEDDAAGKKSKKERKYPTKKTVSWVATFEGNTEELREYEETLKSQNPHDLYSCRLMHLEKRLELGKVCRVCKSSLSDCWAMWPEDPEHAVAVCDTCVTRHASKLDGNKTVAENFGLSEDEPAPPQFSFEVGERINTLPAPFNVSVEKSSENNDSGVVEEEMDAEITIPIAKVNTEQRLVTGIVLEPETVDAHEEIYSEKVVSEAAYNFLADYNRATEMGYQHVMFGEIGVSLVESWVAKSDFRLGDQDVKKGSWLITVKVASDVLWDRIKNGSITGFSVGGIAAVVPAEV